MVDDRTLTEREVLAAARTIRELEALRRVQGRTGAGKIVLRSAVDGISEIQLEADEVEGVIALLIERHTSVLTGLNILPERTPA